MGWFNTMFSGKDIAEPVDAVGNVLDKLFTSDEERLDKELLKLRLMQKPALVQAEITKAQVQSRSVWVAGARPAFMWVCALGFFMAFVLNPIMQWLRPDLGVPEFPIDAMMELTLAMLGLGAMRMVEKIKGVSK